MENPLVSIIIPVFNRAHLISETVDSVFAQTYENWECIIVDDHSDDDSFDLLQRIVSKDSRISLYKRPMGRVKGAAACRNTGIEKANGTYIQFLDSDDILHPEKLQLQINSAKDPDTLLTSKWGYFSSGNYFERFKYRQKGYRDFRNPLKLLNIFGKYDEFLPIHNYLIPLPIIEKAGSWNEELGNNDDAEFMTRVLLNTGRIKFVPGAYVFYRVEGKQTLSGFGTEDKAYSALHSLILIEKNLPNSNFKNQYLNNLKRNFLNRIKQNFPELHEENKIFLRPSKKKMLF